MDRPESFLCSDEKTEKTFVSFKISEKQPGRFFFNLKQTDIISPVIIKPELVFSTFFGGKNDEWGQDLVIDEKGAVYITGTTKSADFPVKAGFELNNKNNGYDLFITKFDKQNMSPVYSVVIGGGSTDIANGITVDNEYNIYAAGHTESEDFLVTTAVFSGNFNGGDYDLFVCKLGKNTGRIIYSTYIGGKGFDRFSKMSIDKWRNIYVTGITKSDNFPVVSEAFDKTCNEDTDAFMLVLNSVGTALQT